MKEHYHVNLNRVPEELILMLEIITSGRDNGNQINPIWIKKSKNLNWHLFLELAIHHRIYPLLYFYMKKVDTYKIFPSYISKELSLLYKINTFQMLQLRADMENISKLLSGNQIRLLFLKGPILATELYGNLSFRTSCDLDILISMSDLTKVEKVLFEDGYEKDDYIKTVLGDWKWRHHHFTYFHPEKNHKLEVHWRLNPGPGKEPNFEKLWERKRTIMGSLNSLYYLGEEDLFFFLITHGARHGWSRLRWLMDIDQMVRKNINWNKVRRTLKKFDSLHLAQHVFILLFALLKTKTPTKIQQLALSGKIKRLSDRTVFYFERMVNLHSETIPDDVSRYHKKYLLSLMSNQQKIIHLLSYLYPYPTDLETLPLPSQLHFLYFLLRPFLCAWRKTGTLLSERRT